MISISITDLGILFLGSICTTYLLGVLISWSTESMGLIDFLTGQSFKTNKIQTFIILFALPFITGILLSFFKVGNFLAATSIGLGAFFHISPVFFQINLLELRILYNLFKVRYIYLSLVIMYSVLGFAGAFVINDLYPLISTDSLKVNLLTNSIWGLGIFVFIGLINHRNRKFSNDFNSDFSYDFAPNRSGHSHQPSPDNDHNTSNYNPKSYVHIDSILNENIENVIYSEINKSIEQAIYIALTQIRKQNREDFKNIFTKTLISELDQVDQMIDLTYEQEDVREKREEDFNIKKPKESYYWPKRGVQNKMRYFS